MAAGGGLPHPLIYMDLVRNALGLQDVAWSYYVLHTWLVMIILFSLAFMVRGRLQMVPGGLQNVFEMIIGGLEDFVVSNIGEEGRKVFPVLITLFLYILFSNYMGLIPGMDAPTANINTIIPLAIILFLYYNYHGIRKWGFGYIKHFMGPVAAMAPLMLILELISHFARPLSLTLRLFGNIRGEEIVLVLLFFLAPVFSTIPMYFLFLLAKSIQAFIFFMLGTIYLQGSLDHAH